MPFGELSNLYVIGRYLDDSFLTESFKSTEVFSDYIADQTFERELTSGALDLSAFTNVSETFTVTNLTFKLIPNNSSDIEIELKYNGQVQFNKSSAADSHYSSFSTSGLRPTIEILDKRNGGNTLLTNLFAFDQINISGTGYFETINDVINIALVRDEVDLRYDSLDIDFTNTSNEAISIDLDATATDTYNASKSVNGVNVETTVIGVDNGDASFSIAGTLEGGNTLSLSQDVADPDGTGTLSYSWQISSDNSNWSEVGTSSTYVIADSDQGKKIRAVISYTDNEGHSEQITTVAKDIFYSASSNEGITATGQSGNDLLIGSNNADTLDGAEGNDEIQGGDGNDTIKGGSGNDTLYGGGGNDTIYGGYGLDNIYGGDGDDTLRVTTTNGGDDATGTTQLVDAGSGDDYVYGNVDQKVLLGDGDDYFDGDFRYLDAGSGDDRIRTRIHTGDYWSSNGSRIDFLDGGEGYDILDISSNWGGTDYGSSYLRDVIVNFEEIRIPGDGISGGGWTLGSQAASSGETLVIDAEYYDPYNTKFAYAGDANITYKGSDRELSGNDTVVLGSGDDTVTLNEGNDVITPGAGDDTIDGGKGDDIAIFSGNKSDYTITETGYGQYTVADNRTASTWSAADIATSADGAMDSYVADLNGDGYLDIVTASMHDNTIAWYENNKDRNPTFTKEDIRTDLASVNGIFVADVDGDGDLDIVSASANDDAIKWHENNGSTDPYFTPREIATSADEASKVFVADLDGDGDLDIVSSSRGDDTIAWYENDGADDPTFTAADIATSADGAQDVHVADLDGDGDLDIISASHDDDTIAWYENDGGANPTFTAADIATDADGAQAIDVADIDGDGDLDIVSASAGDDKIALYENNGAANPTFTTVVISTSADGAHDVSIADVDGDGDLDIVSASAFDDTIAVYTNNGAADPTFTAVDIATNADGASSVFVGDLDRDGDLDIVSTSELDDTIAWYENVRPTGTDTLTAVETLRFDDQDVDITPAGQTLTGTSSADELTGQSGDDNIDGLGGDDTLDGDDGDDEIQGGDGNDTIKGGSGNDTLYGGGGNDTIYGGYGVDTIYGGDGDDTLRVTTTNGGDDATGTTQLVDAGSGDDYVYGNVDQKVLLGDGDDYFDGDFRYLDAGSGDDRIRTRIHTGDYWSSNGSRIDFLDGGEGYDILDISSNWGGTDYGSSYLRDVIVNFEEIRIPGDGISGGGWTLGSQAASSGETLVIDAEYYDPYNTKFAYAGDANITYKGSDRELSGNDTVVLGSGDDTVTLNEGNDVITPGAGDDTIDGGKGDDIAIFSGNKSDYTITETGYGQYTVADNRTASTWSAADIATSADGAMDSYVADLNGDGYLDIVTASMHDNTIAWYENNKDRNPTFTKEDIRTDLASVNGIFVADVDGDGDLDIVSASANDDAIKWHENNGSTDPYFTPREIATSADEASKVFVADLDGDGDLDIVSSSRGDDTIAWYENDGADDPTFTAADIATSADGAQDVHVADLDGDGDLDIISASHDDDTIAWYENDGGANPTFTAADIATDADGAQAIDVADIDGDGDLDIVSASAGDDKIALYENNGAANPTFTTVVISTSADGAHDVSIADVDGDGDLDIVSASAFDDTIAVYTNNGAADPTFTAVDIATNADGASSVFVGDLDRDGDLDIVSTSELDDTIAWYENVRPTGTDTLTAVETLRFDDQDVDITPAGQTLTGTSSADELTGQSGDDNIDGLGGDDTLDGDDGDDEIQGGDGNDTIKGGSGNDTLYGGGGNDTIYGGYGVDTIYGGDGDDTLRVTTTNGGDDATGTTQLVDAGSGDDYVYGNVDQKVLLGDGDDYFDGDFRYLDAGSGDDRIRTRIHTGDYWSSNGSRIDFLDGGEGYDILDISSNWGGTDYGSSYLRDVIVNFEEIRIPGDGISGGGWTLGSQAASSGETLVIDAEYYDPYNTKFAYAGDANITYKGSDRELSGNDTVVLGSGDDTVTLNEGNDVITPGAGDDTIDGGKGDDIAIFSGNKSDYTITETGYGQYTVADNRTASTWSAADIATSADGAMDSYVADLNGDGYLDIVTASMHDNTIAWYENNKDRNPTFTKEDIRTDLASVNGIFVADVDGDGDLDIVSASANDDAIKWHENNGSTDPYFTPREIATSADEASKVFVADLDGDGDLDIVSSSRGDDTIAWYENDGADDPTFTAADIATSADGAQDVHVADLDGDGDLDIISASHDDDTIAWYENDGGANPTFTAADIATDADGAQAIDVADIDGDGDLDIVSASAGDDKIALYENNGAANPTFTTVVISTSADGAHDVSIADVDGDGDLDIVSASAFDDTIAVYTNNGAADPTFTAVDIATNADGASSVFVGDLDRDGDLDIVSTSELDDTIAWYENVRPTGTDTLTAVETLRFDDQDVDITPAGMTISNAGQGTLSSITGSAIVGGTITAGDITGDPDGMSSNPNYAYQWQVASNNVWTDLTNTGSDSRDYVPLAEHVNKSLRVKVTYTDAVGTRGYIYSDPVNIYIPDNTVPTITKAEISSNGNKLILTFSENIIWSAPDGEYTSLGVTVDGSTQNPVTSVNVSNSELQATLSDKILSGQQVNFVYLALSTSIKDLSGNYLDSSGPGQEHSVTNFSNVIGFVNGQPYEGDFHTMDNGMKMTGASHGSGTDQIIYSTIAESTSSENSTSRLSTWTYKYEDVLSLIENKTWSDDPDATVKPLEIVSDSNGSLYILGSVTKPNNSDYMMGMGEDFLGNTLTILSSSGTHTRTIEIADSLTGYGGSNTRDHISASSSGITLINTSKKAFLIDSNGNVTTLIDEPLVANEWEYVDQLRSSSFYDGSFYLQHGGNILRYNESGDLQETINSGWDNVGANMQGNGIEFDVGQDLIAVAHANRIQGTTGTGYFYVLEKDNNGDWIQSTPIQVDGKQAHGVKIDPSDDSIYVTGEAPSGSDGFVAKFTKNSQGIWEQSWYTIDTDSYIFNRLDITDNSQILVTGSTGSGGYSASYDKNGNQTAKSSDSASIDHSTSSFGTGYIRKYPENNGQWLVGLGDGYSDLEMPDLIQSFTSTGNPTVNIDYGSGEVTTPGNSGDPGYGGGSGGSAGDGYNWWEMDYETEETADINDLVQVRRGEKGDAVYTNNVQNDYDKKTYILKDNDTSNDPILITESWGGAAYLNDSWMGGSREVYAVEELSAGGYIIAIKEIIDDQWSNGERTSWQTIQTSATGVLDWNNSSYTDDIAGSETKFNEDLNNDGAIGVDTSNLTLKTTDTTGEKLAVNSQGSLFIVTSAGAYIPVVEEWSGSSITLDESQSWEGGGSFKREALYVGLDNKGTAGDTSDDRYALAVKETNTHTWGGQTHVDEHWVVYDVKTDGSFDWMGTWGAEIADYEVIFDQDIDGDGSKGVDLSKLEKINTDTYGVELKRGSGSLYIVDGDTTLKVKDDYGSNPRLEDSNTWEGGSYSSVGYAVEKKADGSYTLVIKFTETFDDDFFSGAASGDSVNREAMSAYEVHSISSSGVLSWENASFTTAIGSYEPILGQDIDGDGHIGVDLGSLTDITTDTVAHRLKVDAAGSLYIWDGSNSSSMIAVKDAAGGSPSMKSSFGEAGDDFSYSMDPVAVVKIDDYYRVAIKHTDTFKFDGESEVNINWEIYKIKADGEIDWSGQIWTESITSWEDEFDLDLNGDGDKSGQVSLTNRNTDTTGAILASEGANGALYIVDGSTQVAINDSWIESSSNWGDGSYSSTAIAVSDVNNNGTSADTSDDYYQVAVKNSNTWTDWQSGQKTTSEDWQVYAIYASGSNQGNNNWEKTVWTQSIQSYETTFQQDLDGDGVTGLNLSNLKTASGDTNGWLLKKDSKNSLYISDSNGENIKAVKDDYGGTPNFDYSSNWGSGSSSSEAIAAEINADNTFSIAIKHTHTFGSETNTDWEILTVSNSGVLDWSKSVWTQSIQPYEKAFGQDLDGDGSQGLNLGKLSSVDTDTYSDVLKKDNNGNFFILTEAGDHIAITESWGGAARFDYSDQWDGGSWSSKAVAVEDITYTNSDGNSVNGYVIAIKNSGSYGSDQFTDWELRYTDGKGVIDWNNSIWMQSIKSKESLFGTNAAQADLDGDGAFGLSADALTAVSSDTAGDLLKKDDGNALYIIDNKDTTDTSDDVTIAITDQWGGTPTFDWSDSGGYGDYAWAYSSAAYAVESFDDSGTKKFLLAIKSTDTWEGQQNTFWETYVIKESSSGAGDWALDWSSGTWSKAIGKKESVFGQDIDGDGSVYSASKVTTTAISTDTSTTANTAVTLTKDAQGGLYITKGSTNVLIVDSNDAAVAFDWSQTWAGETRTSIAYAVEGIDSDSDNTIDKYKLAVKHELKNNSSNSVTNQWQTIEISTAGVVNWSTETFGEAKLHEADLNQDLDGDGKIWSATSEVLTAVSSDTKGALAYLDSSKNLFIASGSGQTKQAVLDFSGGLISFDETYSLGNFTDKREVLAVEAATVGGTDYYKVLIKNTTSSASESTTAYETVNIKQSTMVVDWGTFSYYVDPKKLESAFLLDIDGDGTITTISSSSTTAIATDTTGAQLRQTSDGSLFIKDSDSTFQITSPDGGYVDLNFTDTFTDGSFKSEAIAVQKVGNDYKLVVKETATFGSNTDISYLVYKLSSAGLIDWGDVTYRTAAELNESEFGQDITGDGNISNGSTSEASDTFADAVTTSNTDAKVLEQFSNTAQSDIYSISNSDSSSSDSKIEMFVKGVDGSAKTDYTMDVSIVQEASAAVLGKVAADTGVSSSNIKALTGVMDFNVTIPDASNYGKIVSLSWVLPDDTRNPVYFKKDPATGEYFDFQFNTETGEGAKWDDSTKTLTVYVRDNGKYDADTTLGKVRDPGMIGDSGDSSDTTAANITGPSGSAGDATSAKSIAENTTAIHTFTANETVSWSFNGGADVSKFSIDSSTGALSFLAAPDYENPTDNGLNNEYVVVVRATDNGSNTSDQTVTVTVTDVDDTNPLITGNTGSAGAATSTKTVSENQTVVHTFTADETVTWSLNGGADASKFSINASTGALSFSSAPDFENPSDANSGNDYVVIVKATDSQGNISNQTVTVSVSNIIESGESGSTTFSKSINENTTAVHTFTSNETVTWSFNGGADVSKFSINSDGELILNSAADFENPADSNTDNDYVIVVRSTDGSNNTVDQTTTITILDVDETPAQITGSSGSAGAATSAKSIQENVTGVHGFTANETVTWSLNGGADASLFEINSSSGTLSFKIAPDYENPTDSDSDNQYVVVVRATDAQNNTSDQTHTVTITDIGEKTNSSDTFYRLSYKKADNSSTITSLFSPTFGTINGALTLNRLSNAPTISNKPSGLLIGQTGIDFELLLGSSAINSKGKTTTDLNPLLDGLTTTGKNIAYFSYTETGDGSSPTANTLTYDPTQKAGARFYDLSGDGTADTVNLELVDGGYGDKDGVKNGIIVDPSTAGVVDLTPAFTASSTALTVADATDTTSPAAFNLSVSISSNASTVNQIGYVALNSNESDTLTYDLIKNRGSILLSNVENSDAPNLSSMDLTADISLINTQKLVFFEVVDTTLESLLANNTNLDGFGSSFKILNLSDTTTNSANASNGGNTIAISLQQGFSGVNDLIASDLGFNPILDFSGFAGLSLEGSVSVAREAKYNSTVGFYKIENSNGAVTDPITGDLITPGTSGYAEAALNSSNLFSSLGTLSTSDGNTITSSITSFSDAQMIAPYASVHNTGQTYFSFTEANADGISHFREFGNGVIGLEDLYGGGDNDFDDLIFGFDLKLTV